MREEAHAHDTPYAKRCGKVLKHHFSCARHKQYYAMSAPQDGTIRVWCVAGMEGHLDEIRRKYVVGGKATAANNSADSTGAAVPSQAEAPQATSSPVAAQQQQQQQRNVATPPPRPPPPTRKPAGAASRSTLKPVFSEKPYMVLSGHEGDVLDMCWSKVCVRLFV